MATKAKREPLRPRSSNNIAAAPVLASARRGPASAEKENRGHGKAAATATAAAEPLKPAAKPAPAAAPPRPMKPSSLQLRMEAEAPLFVGPRGRELLPPPPSSSYYEAWDLSDCEAAPASSWATLPNRALLCRPLPQDVGRCTCVIAREAATGARGVALYSLYTNEGQGRQDRKLAVARHRRRRGRSEFIVAQTQDAIFCTSDSSFLGTAAANLVGSKYRIWGQGNRVDELKNQSRRLLGVVAFAPTITTLTGSFRSMRAWIPKNQSMQLKTNNSAQIQHVGGLPNDWQEKKSRADQLCSRAPFYNHREGWKDGVQGANISQEFSMISNCQHLKAVTRIRVKFKEIAVQTTTPNIYCAQDGAVHQETRRRTERTLGSGSNYLLTERHSSTRAEESHLPLAPCFVKKSGSSSSWLRRRSRFTACDWYGFIRGPHRSQAESHAKRSLRDWE